MPCSHFRGVKSKTFTDANGIIWWYTVNENDNTATLNERTYVVSQYVGEIEIPGVVSDGTSEYVVTSIGEGCFNACTKLTGVSIPQSVTSLESKCFYGCTSLENISIPEGVTSIGTSCFNGCTSLESISIPEGVTSLASGTFSGCSSLESISIPEGLTSIGESCFYGCSSLESISIPEGVTSLEWRCFYGCTSLLSVSLGGVTSLGQGCFYGCTSLRNISIPEGVTSIGSSCFTDCTSLRSISIPEGVTSIAISCFRNCSSLKSVSIPESVTQLADNCFYGCSVLKSITIPENVTKVGQTCFYGCSNLQSITFLGTPESINSATSSVTIYQLTGECTNLSEVNIPVGSLSKFYGRINYLRERVVKIGQTGYATICSYHALSFSDTGVTAYTGKVNEDETALMLSEVTEAAAGEGLVVKADPGIYVLPLASGVSLSTDNDLIGLKSTRTQSKIQITPDKNCYALRSYDDGSLAFAKIISTLNFPTGRAYLKLSDSQAAQMLSVSFGGETTGIKNVTTEKADCAYYDLKGIRVMNPTRGIYIRNGKSVFVK